MFRRLAVPGVLLAGAVLALSGCAVALPLHIQPPIPSSWILEEHQGEVVYLTWTAAKGNLTGTASTTVSDGVSADSTGPAVSSSTVSLSGDYSGGKITVRLGGALLGATLAGRISPDTLIFDTSTSAGNITITGAEFHPGNSADYDGDVRELASQVDAARTAAATAAADARYQQLITTTIPDDVQRMKADEATLATAVAAVRRDYTALFDDADEAKCFDSTPADNAETAFQTLQTDTATANNDADAVGSDANTVTQDLTGLNGLPPKMTTAAGNALSQSATAGTQAAQEAAAAAEATTSALDAKGQSINDDVFALPEC